uniref:Wsv322-like protein n=1 Tax=Sicyonia whispovirus TaxID=2984283 RepID=A0A9C7EZ34_9VIRU|nr:MAG: wsv322-like protein [Sicyonia whispovirus]
MLLYRQVSATHKGGGRRQLDRNFDEDKMDDAHPGAVELEDDTEGAQETVVGACTVRAAEAVMGGGRGRVSAPAAVMGAGANALSMLSRAVGSKKLARDCLARLLPASSSVLASQGGRRCAAVYCPASRDPFSTRQVSFLDTVAGETTKETVVRAGPTRERNCKLRGQRMAGRAGHSPPGSVKKRFFFFLFSDCPLEEAARIVREKEAPGETYTVVFHSVAPKNSRPNLRFAKNLGTAKINKIL